MDKIRVDYTNTFISEEAINAYGAKAAELHEVLESGKMDFTGWVDYPKEISPALIAKVKKTAEKIRSQCTAFVICGVGGSYLGAKAALSLLQSSFHNELVGSGSTPCAELGPKIYFAGHHLGSTYYEELLEVLEDQEVACCVISKSGKTMETSIAFTLIKNLLYRKYGEKAASRIYAVTDESTGLLRAEVHEKGYESFVLDEDIGGRYSVLTPVGLLPLAVAGIDIEEILAGARMELNFSRESNLLKNDCYQYAVVRHILGKKGKTVEAFASFEPKLQYFGEWLKQLFGESEGKEGKGIFPAYLQFSSDLHSMGQFLQEGNPIFFETFLKVAKPQRDSYIKDPLFAPEGRSLHEINCLVETAASSAHIEGGAPCIFINLPDLSPEGFGQMVYFFEKACAMTCLLAEVNPFDQPGVEKYKANIRKLMGQ